ncbi:MAG: hypothetical protein J0M12_14345 [Deltaproteobacteria bacterium]|nr:hypothetical protein [Deltaproteobacteria bacterium]
MPTTVVSADVPQATLSVPDSTWDSAALPAAPLENDLPIIEREHVSISSSDVLSDIESGNLRRAAKDLFLLMNGVEQAVRGLGFTIRGADALSPGQREAMLLEAERREQSVLEWPAKLECAAFRTAATLPAPDGKTSDRNSEIVAHLKSNSEVGDIIFVSSEGAGEPLLAEVFQAAYRRVSARDGVDHTFPFWHVLINVGDDKLLHMTFKGVHETTWERLLVKHDAYDAIAIGRIDAPLETRQQFALEAREFAENRHYNYLWALLSGPLSLMERQDGGEIVDTSATATRSVCLDLATESARALRAEGAPLEEDLESAVTPLDLFSAPSVKIMQAAALKRAA